MQNSANSNFREEKSFGIYRLNKTKTRPRKTRNKQSPGEKRAKHKQAGNNE